MDGVAKDMERQEQRRFENMYVLEQQLELSKKLQANQGLVVEETWSVYLKEDIQLTHVQTDAN